ncbi:hypothetical protein [Geotalea toluenoxydans]|uniref:hypothetical protein n=1 Tax=Geotalea toluenoxydans TaxID=421624 RepID=UPI000B1F7F17|nr:hypothetical protein [Geotalea toluenoxydans]
MDTVSTNTLLRKAAYCRCGIILLDKDGHVAALNKDFFDTADLDIREGPHFPGNWAS